MDVQSYNNKKLMIDFIKNPIKIRGLTSNGILLGRRKVKIRFTLKDRIEGLVFILINIIYLLNSLSNLISLGFLNNAGIYYHNKDQILYNIEIQKTFTFAKQYKTSFFLYLLNLLAIAINLLKNSKIYKKKHQI